MGKSNAQTAAAAAMPIAIVGMSCRLAGEATSPAKLWDQCTAGRSSWSEIPKERFEQKAYYHPEPRRQGSMHVRGGHFMAEDPALFDASFFGLSTEAATSMDPQLRLALESTFEALENAGLPLDQVAGTDAAVFAGTLNKDYYNNVVSSVETMPRDAITGVGAAMLSNRISHFFDLRGPSATIDTGCSASLVCLHLACQSIRTGESSMAIVTAANLLLNPETFVAWAGLGILSGEGRCFPFDGRAPGYGRGEGVATVVLKPLHAARRDNDSVRAIIRATAVNSDGKTRSITSPSQEAQEALMRQCYGNAGLDPLETAYVEAHSTGTRVGDPVEAAAISAVFGRGRSAPAAMASIKGFVGHTEPVSGLVSLIRAVLSLERGFIPPSMDIEELNTAIPFEQLNLRVPLELERLPLGVPCRVSINNFGYGGSNSHAIVERPCRARRGSAGALEERGAAAYLFPLSAKDGESLREMQRLLHDYVASKAPTDELAFLGDLAYTLTVRRTAFGCATAVHARSVEGLLRQLKKTEMPPARAAAAKRLGFVFTGQGAQWYAMGRELIGEYAVFDLCLEDAERALRRLGCPWSLKEELLRDESASRIHDVSISQPACTAIQISLVELLASWRISPSAVAGHSSGEIAAAYAAGALNLGEAMALAYYRGSILTPGGESDLPRPGGMLAVSLSRKDTQVHLDQLSSGRVVVACVNGPRSTTVSGDQQAIEELELRLGQSHVWAKRLVVPVAYHSHHMHRYADSYARLLEGAMRREREFHPGVEFFSSTTGDKVDSAQALGPRHWARSLSEPVLFDQSLGKMCVGVAALVEVGPHGALKGPVQQILSRVGLESMPYAPCLLRGKDARQTAQGVAATVFRCGLPVDLASVNRLANTRFCVLSDLPSYPWNHTRRFWHEPLQDSAPRRRKEPLHHILGCLQPDSSPFAYTWRRRIALADAPWLRDYRTGSDVLYPAAAYILMAIEATRQTVSKKQGSPPIREFHLQGVDMPVPLRVPDDAAGVDLRLSLRPAELGGSAELGWYDFIVFSVRENDGMIEHCKGKIGVVTSYNEARLINKHRLQTAHEHSLATEQPETLYAELERAGLHCGPSLRTMEIASRGEERIRVSFTLPDTASLEPASHDSDYAPYLAVLQQAFLSASTAIVMTDSACGQPLLPRRVDSMAVGAARLETSDGRIVVEVASPHGLFDKDIAAVAAFSGGAAIAELEGLRYELMDVPIQRGLSDTQLCSKVTWKPDLFLLSSKSLQQKLEMPLDAADELLMAQLERVVFYYMEKTLDELVATNLSIAEPAHTKFVDYMTLQAEELRAEHPEWLHATPGAKQLLTDTVASRSLAGEVVRRVGEEMASVLRGDVVITDLLDHNGLLDRYLASPFDLERSLHPLRELLGLFSHKAPQAKVLEVGNGTASCMGACLAALSGVAQSSSLGFSGYDFADASPEVVAAARKRFGHLDGPVAFRTLALEEDLLEKSFEAASYDLVIAHGTMGRARDLNRALLNVKWLLKPGGTFIIVERAAGALHDEFCLGLLPPQRVLRRLMSDSAWGEVLSSSGFNVKLVTKDSRDSRRASLNLIMAVAASQPTRYDLDTTVIYAEPGGLPAWLTELNTAIARLTKLPLATTSLQDADPREKVVIFVDDAANPVLDRPEHQSFALVKELVLAARSVLWVSHGGLFDCPVPKNGLAAGFLRSLRLENSAKRFALADLDPADSSSIEAADFVAAVYRETMDFARDARLGDWEFAQRGREVYLPRVVRDAASSSAASCVGVSLDTLAPCSYIIVGGTGAVGSLAARLLVRNGARNLIFLSRKASAAKLPSTLVEEARVARAKVTLLDCDVSDAAQLAKILALCESEMPPIRGVIYAAAVWRDSILEHMSFESWSSNMRAKLRGPWNIHTHFADRNLRLDFFIMLSSVTGVTGSVSQAAYTAGNTFIDALAEHRASKGLPAVSIAFGPFASAGLVAENPDIATRFRRAGYVETTQMQLLGLLQHALAEPIREPGSSQVIAGLGAFDCGGDGDGDDAPWTREPRFCHLRKSVAVKSPGSSAGADDASGKSEDLHHLLARAMSVEQARHAVAMALADKLSKLFLVPSEQIDTSRQLAEYGVDSLAAIDIRNWLSSAVQASVSIFHVNNSSLDELAMQVVKLKVNSV